MKVMVIDDHPLVWEGIKAVLETETDMEATAWAGSGQEAEQICTSVQPDVALVDLRLPGEYGIDIINKIRPLVPRCKFVVLTTFTEPNDIKLAMEAGVDGYILKQAFPEEMISALRLVNRGRPYFDPAVMKLFMHQPNQNDARLKELTGRETEVLMALAGGMSNKEIASLLFVTEHTVRKHISSILSKLELKDRTQAALYAVAHGVEKPSQVISEAI